MCEVSKPTTDYFSNKHHKTGFDAYCKSCRREYSRKHYQMQKEYYTAKNTKRKKVSHNYVWDVKVKSKCVRCGFDNPAALDFHHRDSTTKEFSISKAYAKGIGLDRIKKEIAKCDILCANCHRIEHCND